MITEKEAITLLKKHSPSRNAYEKVLSHSMAVQRAALRIAGRIRGADSEFIRIASILHDIGRFRYPPGAKNMIRHGLEGAKILASEKLPDRFGNICERHIGCGITKNDVKAQKLPLPEKSYVPRTINEKIISYADNLIFGSREGTIKEVIERYRAELGEKYAERIRKQHQQIMDLIKESRS